MTASTSTILSLGPLLIGAVLAVIIDAFGNRKLAVVCAIVGLTLGAAAYGTSAATSRSSALWGALHVGGVFSTLGTAIAALAAVAVVGGWGELSTRDWGGSLAGLIAFGAAASIVVAQSKDVTLLLIGLETAAACGYTLVSLGRMAGSREAALKYFVQGAIATAFFVLGMGVLVTVYLPTGDLDSLREMLSGDVVRSVALAGVVLMAAALAFKAGAVPFHSWAPDAYSSASPSSAAFLAAGPKVGAIAALSVLIMFATGGTLDLSLTGVMTVLAVLSVLVGSVTALRQRSYTRMLGYAGVAQVGYALIGIATAHQPQLVLFFIVSYAIASTGTFLSAAAFREVRPDWDGTVEGLAGIGRQAPVLAVATSVLVISLAGIPPLLGFWAKFVVFATAFLSAATFLSGGQTTLGVFAAVAASAGVIGSVVSLGYYGGVLRALFAPLPAEEDADEGAPAAEAPRRPSWSATAGVVLLSVVVVVIGLVPLGMGLDALVRFFA